MLPWHRNENSFFFFLGKHILLHIIVGTKEKWRTKTEQNGVGNGRIRCAYASVAAQYWNEYLVTPFGSASVFGSNCFQTVSHGLKISNCVTRPSDLYNIYICRSDRIPIFHFWKLEFGIATVSSIFQIVRKLSKSMARPFWTSANVHANCKTERRKNEQLSEQIRNAPTREPSTNGHMNSFY